MKEKTVVCKNPPPLCKTCLNWVEGSKLITASDLLELAPKVREHVESMFKGGCFYELVPKVKKGVESCEKYKDKQQYRIHIGILVKILKADGYEVFQDEGYLQWWVRIGTGKDRKNGRDLYVPVDNFELNSDLKTVRFKPIHRGMKQ